MADTLKSKYIASPLCSMLHDLCMKECKDMHAGPIDGALYLGFVDTLGFGTAIANLSFLGIVFLFCIRANSSNFERALEGTGFSTTGRGFGFGLGAGTDLVMGLGIGFGF